MNALFRTRTSAAVILLTLLVAACGGHDDHRRDRHESEDVDIRTPIGSFSAKPDETGARTGLPIFPNARPARDDRHDSGNVNIDTPLFTLAVATAAFDVDAAPSDVVAYYRQALGTYGAVTECRGHVDFKGRHGEEIVCREHRGNELQLAVGTREGQRSATVRPSGQGSRFELVYVQAREGR